MEWRDTINPQQIVILKRFAVVLACATILAALLVLFGWYADLTLLKSILPGMETMKPLTAVGFSLAGGALLLQYKNAATPLQRRIGRMCAVLVAAIGMVILLEYATGRQLGSGLWLFRAAVLADGESFPGRPSLLTGINFLILGGALLFPSRAVWPAALLIFVTAGVAIVGYVYEVSALYQIELYGTIAVHTAMLFIVITMSALLARPEHPPVTLFTTHLAGGRLARLLLPAAIIIPLSLGWLLQQGQQREFYGIEFELALFAVSNSIVFAVLVFWMALALNRADYTREQALRALEASEEQLRQIFDKITGYVGLFTTDGVLLEVNNAPLVAAGLRREDVIGRPLDATYWWSDLPEAHEQLQGALAAAARGETVRYDTQVRMGAGRVIRVDLTLSPLYGADGRVVQVIGSAFDVTDRELHAAELEQRVVERTSELQAVLARTETLYLLSRTTQLTSHLPDLLQAVVDRIAALLPADRVVLILIDLDQRVVTHFVRGGGGAGSVVTVEFDELWDGLSGWALRRLQPALSPGGQPDPRESPDVQRRRAETDCGAIIVAPLHYRAQIIGTLTVINRPDQPDFVQADADLLMLIANQTAIAIENARLLLSLRNNEARLRALFEVLPVGVLILDGHSRVVDTNPALEQILDLSREQLLAGDMSGRTVIYPDGSVMPQEAWPPSRAAGEQRAVRDVELGIVFDGGATIWTNVSAVPLPATDAGVVVAVTDISERKRTEDQVRYAATHDLLTGLPNRALFTDRLNQAFERARRHPRHQFAVLYLDLDRFKQVNDTFGHHAGDHLLVASAHRIEQGLREVDTVARLGGDEFVILLDGIDDVLQAIQVAERIIARMMTPVTIDGREVHTAASIGIAMSGSRYRQPQELLRDADAALYQAKAQGRGRYAIA
jgi:diguanylate cyclase (GGDEF)-like protein/PAS domain S-box-containing protein